MKKIIVTGATGFLGRRVCEMAVERGYEVMGIGRNRQIGRELGVPFYSLDLRHISPQIPFEADVLIHCAALSSPWGRKEEFISHNAEATLNVAELCKNRGIRRLIHVSTPSLYFDFSDRFEVKETDPLSKRYANHYVLSKKMAEDYVDAAEGLEKITFRPRGIFGPGDPSLFPRILRVGRVPLFNRGEALLDITYVDNVVEALLLGVEANSRYSGKKYNVTNGDPRRLKELLEAVFRATGQQLRTVSCPFLLGYGLASCLEGASSLLPLGEPLLTRYTVGVLAKSQTLSIQAVQEDLGYVPRVSIEQGIDEFAKWWRLNS